ncbi:calcium-activated chloride channel regulator 2-like isoform X2 [Engystomops pustulosus]|uniref:calcium-activated chloride channel regulator 2-like isoform X2 n=1 Tax=Engystomops pustulosus TaxID=76066 RepID=UPI003AFB47C7
MQAAMYLLSLAVLCWKLQQVYSVQLRDHGYEDVIIAVHPQVPENPQIITAIKDMVSEASFYLFNSTKRRFFYREVKILVPNTWQSLNFQRPRYEAHQKASVMISNPNFSYGNDPYTLHYKGCGNKGKYIHFTPDFLMDDNLLPVYGPRGKVFLHEWAHFQWGVFDEYNYEKPFFLSVDNEIKATRCSSEMVGMYVCKKRSCSDGECIIDPLTGNLEEGCMFLANSNQKGKSSIMYMQSLSSIVEFCTEQDHDKEAPNMQNKICSYRSSWDVIKSSADFKSTKPILGTGPPPPPSFLLLRSRARVICLVLDISDNMAKGQQFHRLRQASAIFLQQLVEPGSYVGIVTFNETAEVKSTLRHIVSEDVRWNLTSCLPDTVRGGMSVCEGISAGLQVNKGLDGIIEGSEIILAVSGRDTSLPTCLTNVLGSGSVIHTIAVGHDADPELESLTESTGGKMFFTSNNKDSDNLIGAFTEIFPVNKDPPDLLTKITSVQRLIEVEGHFSGLVIMDKTVGNDTVFTITWEAGDPPYVIIRDPSGFNYTNENFDHNLLCQVSYLKIPGMSQAGFWTYIITNTLKKSQVVGILVTSRPSSSTIPPITISGEWTDEGITPEQPMTVFAEFKQGHIAVQGANVTAVIESESGDPIIVTLKDNGAGTINMNPPKPIVTSFEQRSIEPFSRIHFLGSFKVSYVLENMENKDIFPPCRIVDLEARLQNDYAILTWTAPGDNYDQGSASSYDIRMSNSPSELQQHFPMAVVVNTSSVHPKPAGSRETFSFKLHNGTGDRGIILYIAIRATDKAAQQSPVSNVVHVTRHVLQLKDLNFAISSAVPRFNTTVIVISLSVLSLCLLLGGGLYCWRKQASFQLLSDAHSIELQEFYTGTPKQEALCKDQELPMHVTSTDDISEETVIILEERTDF